MIIGFMSDKKIIKCAGLILADKIVSLDENDVNSGGILQYFYR